MSLTPRGMSIQEAYRLYASSKLSVNRRYQRKLVWSSKEKMHLINSVQNELPIPLFMFAKFDDEDDRLEIIDVNAGVKLGHGAAQNWATLGFCGSRILGGGQSAALFI